MMNLKTTKAILQSNVDFQIDQLLSVQIITKDPYQMTQIEFMN